MILITLYNYRICITYSASVALSHTIKKLLYLHHNIQLIRQVTEHKLPWTRQHEQRPLPQSSQFQLWAKWGDFVHLESENVSKQKGTESLKWG